MSPPAFPFTLILTLTFDLDRRTDRHTISLNQTSTEPQVILEYRILPNKGAGRVSKATSNIMGRKLRFWAFQRWFRIENRTIIKETVYIFETSDRFGFPQTMGAPLLGEASLIGRIRYMWFWSLQHTKLVITGVWYRSFFDPMSTQFLCWWAHQSRSLFYRICRSWSNSVNTFKNFWRSYILLVAHDVSDFRFNSCFNPTFAKSKVTFQWLCGRE